MQEQPLNLCIWNALPWQPCLADCIFCGVHTVHVAMCVVVSDWSSPDIIIQDSNVQNKQLETSHDILFKGVSLNTMAC